MNEPQSANPAISWMRVLRKRLSADYSDEQDELSAQQLTEMLREAGLTDTRFIPQGLWSTPFAEVVLHPIPVARVLIGPLCGIDAWLEKAFPSLMRKLAWNLIAVGRRP